MRTKCLLAWFADVQVSELNFGYRSIITTRKCCRFRHLRTLTKAKRNRRSQLILDQEIDVIRVWVRNPASRIVGG
jgi:hypothetical protein